MCRMANESEGLIECPLCYEWLNASDPHVCGVPPHPTTTLTDSEKDALARLALSRARADISDGEPLTHTHAQRILTAIREDRQMASITTVRAALFDVIDAGWQCSRSCDLRHPWAFPTEMFAGDAQPNDDDLQLRDRFVDAVIARIAQLQAPPHNFDATLRGDSVMEGDSEEVGRLTRVRREG
jgi:hypothetical protein